MAKAQPKWASTSSYRAKQKTSKTTNRTVGRGGFANTKRAKKPSVKGQAKSGKYSVGPAWWFLFALIPIACICVGVALWCGNELTNEKIANRKIVELAAKYYEENLYPSLLAEHKYGEKSTELSEIFDDYAEKGLAPVRLRQFLNYYDKTMPDVRDIFSRGDYLCDTNASYVIYKPVEPYGVRDYEATYNLYCGQ